MVRLTTSFTESEPIVPTPFGLLSPAVNVVRENRETHWEGGFDYERSNYVRVVNISAGSNTVSAVVFAPAANAKTFTEYVPFVVQVDFSASTFGNNPDEIRKAVEKYLDVATQKALEREFWTGEITKALVAGDATFPNRYLAATVATDVTPTPGTGVKPMLGLALLEKAIADNGIGERGTIHAPRLIASALPGIDERDDDILTTIIGTPVVAGAGYTGSGPNGTVPAAGRGWAYATGPVTVHLGPIDIYQQKVVEAVNPSNNTIIYRATRVASATWPSTIHHGVLIDLTL